MSDQDLVPLKRVLRHEKVEPYKPLALEMGMKQSGEHPALYFLPELGGDVLFTAQGMRTHAPRCDRCNDVGYYKGSQRGAGAADLEPCECRRQNQHGK